MPGAWCGGGRLLLLTPAVCTHPRSAGSERRNPAPLTNVRRDDRVASEALDDRAGAEATAAAHRDQAVAAADALDLVEGLGHQERPGAAERVAEGDGAAVGVRLLEVGPDLLGPRQHDRR